MPSSAPPRAIRWPLRPSGGRRALSPPCSACWRYRNGGVVYRAVSIDQAREAELFQSEKQAAHLRVAPMAVPSCSPYAARSKRRREGIGPNNSACFHLGNYRSKRDGPRIRARCNNLLGGITGFRSQPRWGCHRLRASRTSSYRPAYHERRPVVRHSILILARLASRRRLLGGTSYALQYSYVQIWREGLEPPRHWPLALTPALRLAVAGLGPSPAQSSPRLPGVANSPT